MISYGAYTQFITKYINRLKQRTVR